MIGIIPLAKLSAGERKPGGIPPITPSRFESVIAKWAHIAKYGESGSIYYYTKANLLWRINQLQNTPNILHKYFGNKRIGYIDAELSLIEDENDMLHLVSESNAYDVIFVLGIDKFLLEKNRRIFSFLEHWHGLLPQISFIYFFQIDFLHPEFSSLFSSKSVFLQNFVFETFHPKKDCIQFIHHMAAEWKMEISPKQTHAILETCGLNFWLIKEALRRFRDEVSISSKELMNHQSLLLKVQSVWNSFLSSEQNVFTKLILKKNIVDPVEKHSLEFLATVGWIDRGAKNFRINVPILEQYIRTTVLKFELEINRDSITLNKIPIDHAFSRLEKAILKLFIQKKNTVITRDELAEVIWTDEDSYSDWAIDKLISRLRKKLLSLGLEKSIKTVRNNGFMLVVE